MGTANEPAIGELVPPAVVSVEAAVAHVEQVGRPGLDPGTLGFNGPCQIVAAGGLLSHHFAKWLVQATTARAPTARVPGPPESRSQGVRPFEFRCRRRHGVIALLSGEAHGIAAFGNGCVTACVSFSRVQPVWLLVQRPGRP